MELSKIFLAIKDPVWSEYQTELISLTMKYFFPLILAGNCDILDRSKVIPKKNTRKHHKKARK